MAVHPRPIIQLEPDAGPAHAPSGVSRSGLLPGPVWHYRFGQQDQLAEPAQLPAELASGFQVSCGQRWQLAVFPQLLFLDDPLSIDPLPDFGSCLVGVQAIVDGQPVLLRDQHGHLLDAGGPGCLVADQWNWLELDLTDLAGRRVERLELICGTGRSGAGWLQSPGLASGAESEGAHQDLAEPAGAEPSAALADADMRRGSHSGFGFSRGNTYPLTCRPHGAHFLTPVTDARTAGWLYSWAGEGGVPRLQGLAISHQPSPWIGDRSAFQVMPWIGSPHIDPSERALEFSHRHESARPDRYRVRAGNAQGWVDCAMTATQHCAGFAFDFSTTEHDRGIIVDQPFDGSISVHRLPDGRAEFTAWVQAREGFDDPDNPMPPGYVYGVTRQPVRVRGPRPIANPLAKLRIGSLELAKTRWGRPLRPPQRAQAAVLELLEGDRLEVLVSMSFISVQQARDALAAEIGQASVSELLEQSERVWAQLLGRLELDGGTADQHASAYSSLARLFCWPNIHHEIGPDGQPRYASPFRPRTQPDNRERTGCQIVEGELYVNNGYWDTYRTAWPAYHLLVPQQAGTLLNGIAQQYRDSGWMSRWSAPGHIDCMVGTSSDAIFADASAHGIGFDELSGYDSALENALLPSPSPLTGRKSIAHGRFVGWIDDAEPEGFSWSMENANCDAAIALWSSRLADRAAELGVPQRSAEFQANAVYFANRCLSYRALFDPLVGFYQGRRPSGEPSRAPGDFDPTRWGHDFTETDAWGMAFAAVHDGAGLADSYGGAAQLAQRLDLAYQTPECATARAKGSYPYVIHEMVEGRALRQGQVAVSNQPAHHTAWMYLHAGQPWRTQWLTRETCDRLLAGGEIGQGYPGDEDNGEMSAWALFSMLGLYPLQVGSGEFVLSAPLFERAQWTRPDGSRLLITSSGSRHRYIQSVTINGQPWDQVAVPVELLHADCHIHVELGPLPSDWGAGSRPSSMSTRVWDGHSPAETHAQPVPTESKPTQSTRTQSTSSWQPDRTRQAAIGLRIPGSAAGTPSAVDPACLIDDRGERLLEVPAGAVVELSWDQPFTGSHFTWTAAGQLDWRLEARDASGEWVSLECAAVAPHWPGQTVPHLLPGCPISGLRWRFDAPARLQQVEVF